jgi:hypothetical protein
MCPPSRSGLVPSIVHAVSLRHIASSDGFIPSQCQDTNHNSLCHYIFIKENRLYGEIVLLLVPVSTISPLPPQGTRSSDLILHVNPIYAISEVERELSHDILIWLSVVYMHGG